MKKILFYIFLIFLLLLLFTVAYIISSNQRKPYAEPTPSVPYSAASRTSELAENPSFSSPLGQPLPKRTVHYTMPEKRPGSAVRYPVQTVPALSARTVGSISVSSTQKAAAAAQPSVSRPKASATSARGSVYTQAAVAYRQENARPVYVSSAEAEARERQAVLAGAASGLSSKEQRALNERLAYMSASIDRAIAQAMLPKGRRAQNIEKYINQAGGGAVQQAEQGDIAAGNGGTTSQQTAVSTQEAVQRITGQIASQKAGIVNDMKSSYGASAAREAGKIMDGFSREMTSVLNSSASPKEKQILAQGVNHKYNEKLRRLNEKEGMKKTETDMRAQNEKQIQKIAEALGPEVASAVRQKYEEYMPKRMAVMQGGYSAAEATKLLIELDEQMRADVEKIIQQQHPQDAQAMNKYIEAQNQAIQEQQKLWESLPENQRPPETILSHDEESMSYREAQMKKENESIERGFSVYGPEVQQQAHQILEDANARRLELIRSGATASDVNKIAEETNARLKNLQQQAQEDMRAKMAEN